MQNFGRFSSRNALFAALILLLSMRVASDNTGKHQGHSRHHQNEAVGMDHGHSNHGHSNHGHHDDDHHDSVVGEPASEKDASRTIAVAMLDTMRFEMPDHFKVAHGEVITFQVTNKGKIPHEFSIGSPSEHSKHRKVMRGMPHMKHDEGGSAITLGPGETKKLTWKFTGTNEVEFACNIPGHYEAGMKAKGVIQQN